MNAFIRRLSGLSGLVGFHLALQLSLAESASADRTPTYYQDVKPIVDGRCVSCHHTGGIGPFPLTAFEEVSSRAGLVADAVASGRMPPWPAYEGCNEFTNDRSLSQAQVKTLLDWAYNGTPRGDKSNEGKALAPVPGELGNPDLTLTMKEPYRPTIKPDEYRCFSFDYPDNANRFITGFGVRPGNKALVHHMIAFLVPPAGLEQLAKNEAEDPEPGYTCFGDARVDSATWLGAWAPGTQGFTYPQGTGLEIKKGSKVVLQVHYHLHPHLASHGASQEHVDQSAALFKTAAHVDQVGQMIPWTDPEWIYDPKTMPIPAGNANVTHSMSADLAGLMHGPMVVWGAMLHMHQLGKEISLTKVVGEQEQCLARIPNWNFNWQLVYWFKQPVTMKPSEMLKLTCSWDNSLGNQPMVYGHYEKPRDVTWGDGSRDEMCLGILYVTRAAN